MKRKDLVIITKMRWYHRMWHCLLTLLGKECYACEVIEVENYCLEVMRVWLCPGCWRYMGWDRGCAHEDPDEAKLCDDCWCERKSVVEGKKRRADASHH
jgi:hypothetical protein